MSKIFKMFDPFNILELHEPESKEIQKISLQVHGIKEKNDEHAKEIESLRESRHNINNTVHNHSGKISVFEQEIKSLKIDMKTGHESLERRIDSGFSDVGKKIEKITSVQEVNRGQKEIYGWVAKTLSGILIASVFSGITALLIKVMGQS